MHYVYIIYSQRLDIYYKGITQNPEKRLFEHNNNLSRYTSGKGIWEFVYLEKMESKSAALIKEKKIKRLNRRSIQLLIATTDCKNTCLSSRLVLGRDETGSSLSRLKTL